MREVARSTIVAFFLKALGAGLAFGFNVMVARLVGAEGAGLYFLALAIATIGSVLGRVGLDNSLLRFVATRATQQDWVAVLGVYALGMRISVIASGVISVVLLVSAPWIASVLFGKMELVEPLRWMSLAILPFALLNLHAECLKGLKKIRNAMFVQGIGVPLIAVTLIVPMVHLKGTIGVSVAYLCATTVVALLGIWAWRKAVQKRNVEKGVFSGKELWSSARPLFFVSIMSSAILPWTPIFILGVWGASEDVGVFGAAFRVAALVSFMLVAINNVVAPKFAELYSKGDLFVLSTTAQRAAILVTLLASPLLMILIFRGDLVMGIYGDDFRRGALVLSILAIGQFVNAFTGSVGFVLMMGGKEEATSRALLYSVFVLLILCVLLTPLYGMTGTAIALVASGVVKNVLLVRYCITEMNVVPIPFFR